MIANCNKVASSSQQEEKVSKPVLKNPLSKLLRPRLGDGGRLYSRCTNIPSLERPRQTKHPNPSQASQPDKTSPAPIFPISETIQ